MASARPPVIACLCLRRDRAAAGSRSDAAVSVQGPPTYGAGGGDLGGPVSMPRRTAIRGRTRPSRRPAGAGDAPAFKGLTGGGIGLGGIYPQRRREEVRERLAPGAGGELAAVCRSEGGRRRRGPRVFLPDSQGAARGAPPSIEVGRKVRPAIAHRVGSCAAQGQLWRSDAGNQAETRHREAAFKIDLCGTMPDAAAEAIGGA